MLLGGQCVVQRDRQSNQQRQPPAQVGKAVTPHTYADTGLRGGGWAGLGAEGEGVGPEWHEAAAHVLSAQVIRLAMFAWGGEGATLSTNGLVYVVRAWRQPLHPSILHVGIRTTNYQCRGSNPSMMRTATPFPHPSPVAPHTSPLIPSPPHPSPLTPRCCQFPPRPGAAGDVLAAV